MNNAVLFTGRLCESTTGLFDFRSRWLNSEVGGFTARDPSGYADGANLYAAYFVPGRVDPYGLQGGLLDELEDQLLAPFNDFMDSDQVFGGSIGTVGGGVIGGTIGLGGVGSIGGTQPLVGGGVASGGYSGGQFSGQIYQPIQDIGGAFADYGPNGIQGGAYADFGNGNNVIANFSHGPEGTSGSVHANLGDQIVVDVVFGRRQVDANISGVLGETLFDLNVDSTGVDGSVLANLGGSTSAEVVFGRNEVSATINRDLGRITGSATIHSNGASEVGICFPIRNPGHGVVTYGNGMFFFGCDLTY